MRTVQRYERVPLMNNRTGVIGCTYDPETVQVRLENGATDSSERVECSEVNFH